MTDRIRAVLVAFLAAYDAHEAAREGTDSLAYARTGENLYRAAETAQRALKETTS